MAVRKDRGRTRAAASKNDDWTGGGYRYGALCELIEALDGIHFSTREAATSLLARMQSFLSRQPDVSVRGESLVLHWREGRHHTELVIEGDKIHVLHPASVDETMRLVRQQMERSVDVAKHQVRDERHDLDLASDQLSGEISRKFAKKPRAVECAACGEIVDPKSPRSLKAGPKSFCSPGCYLRDRR